GRARPRRSARYGRNVVCRRAGSPIKSRCQFWTTLGGVRVNILMLILGLVGGIASGKSLVANVLRDMGAVVLDADQAGHYVLRHQDVIAELQKRWGDKILDAKGQVVRREVAKIVFGHGNEAERKFLEQLTHPRIEELLTKELEAIRNSSEPPPVVVIDA